MKIPGILTCTAFSSFILASEVDVKFVRCSTRTTQRGAGTDLVSFCKSQAEANHFLSESNKIKFSRADKQ
jgi:hypothetical protein